MQKRLYNHRCLSVLKQNSFKSIIPSSFIPPFMTFKLFSLFKCKSNSNKNNGYTFSVTIYVPKNKLDAIIAIDFSASVWIIHPKTFSMFWKADNKSNLRVQDPKIHNIQRKIYFSSKMCTDLRRFWSIFVFFLIYAKEVEMCPLNKNK